MAPEPRSGQPWYCTGCIPLVFLVTAHDDSEEVLKRAEHVKDDRRLESGRRREPAEQRVVHILRDGYEHERRAEEDRSLAAGTRVEHLLTPVWLPTLSLLEIFIEELRAATLHPVIRRFRQ